jgi:hypothetical protein
MGWWGLAWWRLRRLPFDTCSIRMSYLVAAAFVRGQSFSFFSFFLFLGLPTRRKKSSLPSYLESLTDIEFKKAINDKKKEEKNRKEKKRNLVDHLDCTGSVTFTWTNQSLTKF